MTSDESAVGLTKPPEGPYPIVVFDGECGFCSSSIQFVLRHERNHVLRFAAQQSPVGRQLLERHGLAITANDSVVLFDGDHAYLRSDASLRIASYMGGIWKVMAAIGRVVPRFIREPAYRLVASNRYRIAGRLESCAIPSPEIRHRFLDA